MIILGKIVKFDEYIFMQMNNLENITIGRVLGLLNQEMHFCVSSLCIENCISSNDK